MKVVFIFMSLVLVFVASKNPICLRPAAYGDCKGSYLMYAYSPYDYKCVPFGYSGCGGNSNRFYTMDQCKITCS